MRHLVVLVRDRSVRWVEQYAEAIRATGRLAGLVTLPLEEAAARRLAPAVEAVATVPDLTDPRAVADAALALAGGRPLDALLSASDGAIVPAAEAAELIGVGRGHARGLARSRNKYAAREALRAAGLPVPRYALLDAAADARAVAGEVGLPAVVKPICGTGSHLVRKVESVAELEEAYRLLAERLPAAGLGSVYARPQDRGAGARADPAATFLVEGMLVGRECCVDLIARDGAVEQLALFDKFIVDERFFERGFVTPPFDLDPGRERRIRSAADAAVRALGLDNTVAHVEIIDDEARGPTVVEVNGGRPGGQLLGPINELTTGVNLAAELVAAATGAPSPRTPPKLPIPMAGLTVFAPGSGRVRAVHGLDEAAALPDVISVDSAVRPGEVISGEYEMFAVNLIVTGFLDREDLLATYEQVAKTVRIELAE